MALQVLTPVTNLMTARYTVYWQPGCTSCLHAKEFLTSHGIEYESVNVSEDDSAMAVLAGLGARSVPVVATGNNFVYAQDISVLAKFVGIDIDHELLPPDLLITRLDGILAAAQRYLAQMPPDVLDTRLPGRERTCLDLGYHVFVLPIAFLDAARGGELSGEYFERKPSEEIVGVDDVIRFGDHVRADIQTWWRETSRDGLPDTVRTYYGEHTAHSVLERTVWHTAQHCRQLMALVSSRGLIPDGPLGEQELAGLPLPDEVYDDEVPLISD